jgi:colanic acid/amylovoran biosynthesis glycosyltransferase
MATHPDSLLLELPVPFRKIDGVLHVEAQAHNGIARWLENFDRLTVCAPVIPEARVEPSVDWRPATDLLRDGRLVLHELPWGYHPRDHLRHGAGVRALFRRLIPQHRFMCFGNLGWAGAWGNIAAAEAHRAGRPYAVWLDWELHTTPLNRHARGLKRALLDLRLGLERRRALRAIRQSTLGLFHGQTVFDAYAAISANPQVVHDVHLKKHDLIGDADLQARLAGGERPVRLGYCGRAHEMKAPLDWIASVARAIELLPPGTAVEAVWMGDGPLLGEARAEVERRGLAHVIRFPGGELDRTKVLAFFRSLDLFVFCHVTPESPRCLLEALMSAVPLVGYWSAFAQDLVATEGGGEFVPIGDTEALAQAIARQALDAPLRRRNTEAARRSGLHFSDEAVFAHRSELIKAHLPA